MIRPWLFLSLLFWSASSFSQAQVPVGDVTVYGGARFYSNSGNCSRLTTSPWNLFGSGQSFKDTSDVADALMGLGYYDYVSGSGPNSPCAEGHDNYELKLSETGNTVGFYISLVYPRTEQGCPASHPIDDGNGNCLPDEPESLNDCPIGTMPSSGGGVLGDGSAPQCVPFSCERGGQNVSIPSSFFDVDFGGASFSYCDGSCAYSVQSGSGGDVNAWGTGSACGNGAPEYVYAVPSFDDSSCTSGDGWVDCSENPQKVDEDNPPPDDGDFLGDDPKTPDDLGVPLEDEGNFVMEPFPDCTPETSLSGSCFVNSMDAVQTNIVGGINTEQSQQTDRIVKAIVQTFNGNVKATEDSTGKIVKAIEEGRRASVLPFLTQQFASTPQSDLSSLTLEEIATETGDDLTGFDYDEIIPKVTKNLGWNPSDYQFGVGGGLCPEPTTLNIGGQSISLDWSMFCDMALIINALLIAMAYFIGGQIILRAF